MKWPSNQSVASVAEFKFYNCSFHSSCVSCQSEIGCQWCLERCSSICTESLSQCSSFTLLNPSNIFLHSNHSAHIPLKFHSFPNHNYIECRLNETIRGLIDSNNICHISKIPEIKTRNEQNILLTIYKNNISIGIPLKMFIYRCDFYDTCDECHLRSKCSWCQAQCSSKSTNRCLINEQCTSLRIKDFSPKLIPLNGKTIVKIYLNEHFNESIIEIFLADIPCLVINSLNVIQCQSQTSNSTRKGPISIRFSNSIYILSKEEVEFRQTSIISIDPAIVHESGGQILHINGRNLFIGNERKISIGNYQCLPIRQIFSNILSCRLPSIRPNIYNVTLKIDNQIVNSEKSLRVTPMPIIDDVNPTKSFAR